MVNYFITECFFTVNFTLLFENYSNKKIKIFISINSNQLKGLDDDN